MNIFKLIGVISALVFSINASAQMATDGKPGISRGKYIAGGIVGTAVGFGIGHAVQGRYGEKGWIFTVGEGASLALMMSGLAACLSSSTNCSSQSGTLTLGYVGLLGFHIWEIIDVWTGVRPVSEKNVSFMILPDPKQPQAVLAWRF